MRQNRDCRVASPFARNKHYSDQLVSKQWFEEHVLAQVVMICNVVRPDLLVEATRRQVAEA